MNDAKILVTKGENQNTAKVNLSGELTLISLEKIIPELKSIVSKYQSIVFIIENIKEIDLPGIQLFYSLKKTAETTNKNIDLKFDLSQDIIEKIKISGFESLLN